MGGTALKAKFGFEGQRMSASEYAEVCDNLRRKSPYVKVIPCFENKLDHGDIDCIIQIGSPEWPKADFESVTSRIKEYFGAKHVSKNSDVYSFDFLDKYQVDLVVVQTYNEYLNYLNFCSYSPCGNAMGRMIKQLGLKWGIRGLTYPVKLSDSEQLGEIPVVVKGSAYDTFERLRKFFAFDKPDMWDFFETQEEIFRFLSGNRFFNADIFKLENLNHINRKRDATRKDYHQWLAYIKDLPNRFVRNPDKTVYIPEIQEFFGVDIYGEWEKLLGQHLLIKENAKKFNGEIVQEITGRTGAELGHTIKLFRDMNPNLKNIILVHSKEEMVKFFAEWFEQCCIPPKS